MGDLAGGCLAPEAVQGFVSGTLAADMADRVEQHVDACADCRALLAAIARAGATPAPGAHVSGLEETAAAPESATTEVDLARPRAPRASGHPAAGTRIDRYVIERSIGAGGMGAVSLADDPELKRKVCLKLLRPELYDPHDTQATRARLLREAQAMAQVSHPNVVSVFDIGTYEGQVFIAMEYIEGSDLAAWLKRAHWPASDIIGVFLAAGRGLAAAHRAGLIHRDFKPQNVMIGDDGSVKVGDFGLARAELAPGGDTVDDAPDRQARRPPSERDNLLDSPLTRTGILVGTPAYMAPEQVRGDDIDARCDQFAFAVALHEALAGERPFPGSSLTEIFTAATEGRVRPLPRRARVGRRVRAALERALAPSPSQRFPTMDALLAELAPRSSRRAALAVAGVVAVGGGAAAGLFLVPGSSAGVCDGGAALIAPVWGDAARERVRAGFAATGLKLAATSSTLVVRDLDAYAVEWTAAHRQACTATRVRQEQSEEMMALRMACLERRRAELAATVEILQRPDAELVDSAFQLPGNLSSIGDCADAEALSAPVPLPRDPALRAQIGEIRALVARAKALADAQRLDQADAVAAAASAAAAGTGWSPLVAEATLMGAQIDLVQARHDAAEVEFHAAALAAEQGGHDAVRVEAYLGLLEVEQIRGKLDEALRWAGYARAIIDRTGAQPGELGALSVLLGDVYNDKGDVRRATSEYERAIEFLGRAHGPRHGSVAWAIFRLGNFHFKVRDFEKAVARFDEARRLWLQLGGEDHPLALLALQTMSDVRREQGRPADSLPLIERALAGYRRVYGDGHHITAGAYNTLGMSQQALGRTDEGLASQERALAAYQVALGPRHPYVSSHLGSIARTLMNAGRLDEAATRMEEALAIALQAGENTSDAITFRNALGSILTRAKRHDEALDQLGRALAAAEAALAPDAPQLADTLTRLGTAHHRKGDHARAVAALERAIAIRRSAQAGPWESSWTKLELARALWDAGGDRKRALQLAAESRSEAETAGDAEQAESAATWLAERGGPARREPARSH